jgi:VWFA-related protein
LKRNSAVLCFLFLASFPVFAARHVTVAQVDQVLASANATDAEVSRQILDMQLTERMSTEKLATLTVKCPGPASKQALLSLADVSAFLPLPAAAIPSTPMPDVATQREMIAKVADYVLKTMPMLPNFFATRVTTKFQETPLQQRAYGNPIPYQPMHQVNTSTVTVLYRNGREVVDEGKVAKTNARSKAKADSPGLSTWGVFGPILGTVLGDVARANSLVWSHWQQTESGQQAVYRFSIPKDKSHYQVTYCCIPRVAEDDYAFEQIAGYHGEMAVDPANGTILRLTVQAELKPTDPISRADLVVEYGPVEIGGRTYVAPAKSVSISNAWKTKSAVTSGAYYYDDGNSSLSEIKQTSVNDVEFRDYHLFRADVNILTAGTPRTSGESIPSLASPSTTEVDAAVAATPTAPTERSATPPPAPAPPAVVEAPEYTLVPAEATPHPATNKSGFVLQASARLVDVGFVAYEKKGHPLTNLTQNDIELFDNGRKQSIQLFYQAAPAVNASPGSAAVASPPPNAPPATDTFTNQVSSAPASGSAVEITPSSTILLLDGVHLAYNDVVFARGEAVKFLSRLAPSQPVAVYTMDEIGFHVLVELTQDRALIEAKLKSWTPTAATVSRAQDAEVRNNQHIDTVMNPTSLGLTNGAGPDANLDDGAVVDPQLRDFGANPTREAMRVLIAVARHLARVPGHKSLIWISGDTALIDWGSQKPGTGSYGMKNKYLDEIADKTGEALNQAHISVYPLDASAVQAGGVDASLQNRNVQLTQMAADNASMAPGGAGNPRNMTNGRDAQAMQAEMFGIQEPVRRIAESTGGQAFGRASDLGKTLDTILSDTQATYMASFKPDSAPDDTFHTIVLKVTGKPKVKLRYRSGYLYEKDALDAKASFQQAVWRPGDSTDIGLTAKVVSHSPSTLQVMIALKDVALEQQQGRWTGKLDVYFIQRDEDTGHASSSGDGVQLALKDSSYQMAMKTGFAYQRSLNPSTKARSLRVIVYDENSGRLGSVTLPASALQP